MKNSNLTKKEVITLIYQSECDVLSEKVLEIFLQQQETLWFDNYKSDQMARLEDLEEFLKGGGTL